MRAHLLIYAIQNQGRLTENQHGTKVLPMMVMTMILSEQFRTASNINLTQLGFDRTSWE
jgi:hypothetical protein